MEKIIRKMYFCLCPSASGFLTVLVIWQQSNFTAQCCLLFFFFASLIVHVAPQIRLVVRSGECQHHLSPLLSRTVPEGSTSVRNPLMCSALAYQSVQDVKQLVRGRLSYHNSPQQKVKQECVRQAQAGKTDTVWGGVPLFV